MCPDAEAAFCFPQKYRTANRECNNVKKPMWGVTGAAYLRLKDQTFINLIFILYARWRIKIVCLQTKLASLAICKKNLNSIDF